MQRGKRFKWSNEDYTLREFIEQFSYRLPVTIYITEGWMGRDEDHTFSSDEIYRIGAVKRQRRIVTEHGSGYYVSIPVGTRKKVDLFYPDGTVTRSVSMADVSRAMKSRSGKPESLMFENDTPVPFSFGPDLGAKVDLGKMKIVDLYEERYLVGHCHWNGKLVDRKIPVVIPVYMDLQVATAVGLVGGTDEDFNVLLADIEEQIKGAVTEVDVTEEIMLFPHDITTHEYEYINPMATFSKLCRWSKTAIEMTQSAAYSACPPPKSGARKQLHKKAVELPERVYKRALPKPPPPDPTTPAKTTSETSTQAVVSPVTRSQTSVQAKRPQVFIDTFAKPLPETKTDGAVITGSVAPFQRTDGLAAGSTFPRNIERAGAGRGQMAGQTNKQDCPYDYLSKYRSSLPENCSLRPDGTRSHSGVPYDVPTLSVAELAERLRTLKIPEPCVTALVTQDVDGEMLTSLDENILTDEFQFSRFNAIKLMKHVKEGYCPNY